MKPLFATIAGQTAAAQKCKSTSNFRTPLANSCIHSCNITLLEYLSTPGYWRFSRARDLEDFILQQQSPHRFPFRSQDFFNVPFSFEVGKPVQVVCNEMMLAATVTLDDHYTFLVRHFRNKLRDTSRTQLAQKWQEHSALQLFCRHANSRVLPLFRGAFCGLAHGLDAWLGVGVWS